MTTPSEEVATIADMAAAIGKVLAGHDPTLQGAALADCLALWLAGHVVPGDKHTTEKMRGVLFANHCSLVHRLVKAQDALETPNAARTVQEGDPEVSERRGGALNALSGLP